MASSEQRFPSEPLCRAEGVRNIPAYSLFDDERMLNPCPKLDIKRHELNKVLIDLGGGVKIQPCYYKGEPRVDIRQWEEGGGIHRRSKKGVRLTPLQWNTLLSTKDEVGCRLAAIEGRVHDVDCKFHIGGGHHIALKSPFLTIDLRSWWCPEFTQFRPTTRSMRLKPCQWSALLKSEEKVAETLDDMKRWM